MSKSLKIDKEFLLTNSTVNCYGFRLLTSGYLQSEFEKNPVGYHMHGEEKSPFPREQGVLVSWSDFRNDGENVYAKPNINLTHPRGQRTVDEINSGFLNAASMGHFVVLEMDNNPANALPNQTGPTVTKWFNRECSLVDIPGNFDALKLYDQDGEEINLAAFTNQKFKQMNKTLSAAAIAKLGLKAEATENETDAVINNLVAEAAKVPTLVKDLAAAKEDKATAEKELKDLKASVTEKEVNDIVETALAANKVTAEGAKALKEQFADNPTGLKAVVDTLQAYKPVTTQLSDKEKGMAELAGKSYDELDKSNKLEALKAANPASFYEKYETKFGKKHPEDKA